MADTTTDTAVAPIDAEDDARGGFLRRLYTGAGGIDIIGKSKRWFAVFGTVLAVAILAMVIRGFSLGIDFEGGTRMTMPPGDATEQQVEEVFTGATGVEPAQVQIVGSGEGRIMEVTSESLTDQQINDARVALYETFQPKDNTGTVSPDAVGDSTISESWGSTITERMLIAAGVFLVLVFIYIMIRFERDMAIAAIGGLLVDGVVILGVYALLGLEVTPATIIGLLTVLSFSLYDTVVVFDKVDENTAGFEQSTRRTYGELVNLAVNQTIMRSINTSVSTLLPIIALLVIAVGLLGVGTLADLAVIQFIGIIQGTFSSVLLVAPILVWLKRRQRRYRRHDELVAKARGGEARDASGERDDEPRSGGAADSGDAAVADAAPDRGAARAAARPAAAGAGEDGAAGSRGPRAARRDVVTPRPPREDGDDGETPLTWRPGSR
ncbi:protein translocase subunit SecF [Corynebacterium sp. 335C]